MFINVFLESQKSVTNIVLGNDINESTVEKIEQSYPLPINTIRNIVLHEFGHGLGLGHYESSEPVHSYLKSSMAPSINPFDEKQILSVTYLDLAMIGLIYGENGWKSTFTSISYRWMPYNRHVSIQMLLKCNFI